MPVIRHNNECAKVNAIMFDCETECGDDDHACFNIENGSLRMQRLGDEESSGGISPAMQTQVL